MLQDLAAQTEASGFVIASMVFFIAIWLVIAVRVFRARPEDLEAQARLALEGDGGDGAGATAGDGRIDRSPRPSALGSLGREP